MIALATYCRSYNFFVSHISTFNWQHYSKYFCVCKYNPLPKKKAFLCAILTKAENEEQRTKLFFKKTKSKKFFSLTRIASVILLFYFSILLLFCYSILLFLYYSYIFFLTFLLFFFGSFFFSSFLLFFFFVTLPKCYKNVTNLWHCTLQNCY